MKNIKCWHELVKDVLEAEPYTRNSDTALYMEVCKKANPEIAYMGFLYVFNNLNDLGLPKTETIRRCRQMIQETIPELRAKETVTDARYEAFKAVMGYVANE